jgi:hypothetical protein
VLSKEYRRTVYSHPARASDWTLPYWFLISFWRPGHRVSLFATEQTTLRSVLDCECIGIGRNLADYLIRPALREDMGEDDVLLLASYTLALIKNHVPGCGGSRSF